MALTDPIFVDSDPAVILSEVLSDFENLSGKTIEPAQPEYIIASAIAYHKALAMNRVNAAGKSMLVDFSTAPVLDYLASLFNITRLPAQGAVCTLGFTIVTGHLQVTIPLGTRVVSADGQMIFATDDDVVVPVGVDSVEVSATCQTTGVSGNGYGIGEINTVQDPYAYISAVTNTNITAGGSDEESDDELRSRVQLATSKFSTAGSRNAYIYWAKTASALISDVAIATLGDYLPIETIATYNNGTTYNINSFVTINGIVAVCVKNGTVGINPLTNTENWIKAGEVHIFSLLDNGEIPTTAINDKISQILSDENIRPLTDTVVVREPTELMYSLSVNVIKSPNALGSDLTSSLYTILNDFATAKKQALGLDIVATYIESICRISNVYDVTATIIPTIGSLTGRNLVVSPWQVAKLEAGGITITITGSNNG